MLEVVKKLLKVHARNKKLDPKIKPLMNLQIVFRALVGADIENLLNEGRHFLAARDNRTMNC